MAFVGMRRLTLLYSKYLRLRILNVTLTNKTLPAVILPRLNEQQREIYTVMQQLKGNKPYLWEGISTAAKIPAPAMR